MVDEVEAVGLIVELVDVDTVDIEKLLHWVPCEQVICAMTDGSKVRYPKSRPAEVEFPLGIPAQPRSSSARPNRIRISQNNQGEILTVQVIHGLYRSLNLGRVYGRVDHIAPLHILVLSRNGFEPSCLRV